MGEAARREAASLRLRRRSAHGRKTQLGPGRTTSVGKLRDVKRPACLHRQTGACRSCGPAACQPCRGHEEPVGRKTHSDQLAEDKAQGAHSVPGVQRRERSTPTARPVSSDGSDQLQPPDGCPTGEGLITPTAGLDRGRRARSTPSFRPALPAKDQRQLRFGSIPSWATGGERIILRSCPCNRDHAPRFLWSETLEKAKQRHHYHPARRPGERACRPPSADCRRSVHKS